jgi:hypothetical protein
MAKFTQQQIANAKALQRATLENAQLTAQQQNATDQARHLRLAQEQLNIAKNLRNN